jgi:hypothetical protein
MSHQFDFPDHDRYSGWPENLGATLHPPLAECRQQPLFDALRLHRVAPEVG